MAPQQPTYRRASEFAENIGENLDALAGRDVLLVAYEITARAFKGEIRPFITMAIALDPAAPEQSSVYHSWSESLAEKLGLVPQDALPVLIRFTRVSTSRGYRVWSYE